MEDTGSALPWIRRTGGTRMLSAIVTDRQAEPGWGDNRTQVWKNDSGWQEVVRYEGAAPRAPV